MARGYVQPVTRKQALSYERVLPNPIGVTTLAAVNGRGASTRAARAAAHAAQYRRGYAASKAILRGYTANEASPPPPPPAPAPAAQTTTVAPKAAAAATPNRRGSMAGRKKGRGRRRSSARRAAGRSTKSTQSVRKMIQAEIRRAVAGGRGGKGKGKKGKASRRSGKSAWATRGKGAKGKKAGVWRTIRAGKRGGTFNLLTAQIGGKRVPTYAYRARGGRLAQLHDIPKLVGFASQESLNEFLESGDPALAKRQTNVRRHLWSIQHRREKAAERVLKHGDLFTPNASSYSEWSESMTPNKRRSKKSTKKSRRGHRKGTKAWKKLQAGRRRYQAKRSRRAKSRRGKHAHKARGASKRTRRAAAKRGGRKASRKGWRKGKGKSRRSAHRHHASSHRHGKRGRRRGYRRNGSYAPNAGLRDLGMTLVSGLTVTAGFATHRATRHALEEFGLKKIASLADGGSAAKFRTMIASAAIGLAGVGILQAVKPGESRSAEVAKRITESQVGMIASTILDILVQALAQGEATKPAVAYLSGMGEYVPQTGFAFNQAASGLGSYYAMRGMGAAPTAQAMAAAPPSHLLAQAQAGMGEYYAQNIAASGLGEYFSARERHGLTKALPIHGLGSSDGILPTLSAAERALTVAEAAAGLGDDVPEQSTVDAWQVDMPVTDPDPAASRAYGIMSPFVSETMVDVDDPGDDAAGLRSGVLAGGAFG